eukprot:Rmarinus@m.20709
MPKFGTAGGRKGHLKKARARREAHKELEKANKKNSDDDDSSVSTISSASSEGRMSLNESHFTTRTFKQDNSDEDSDVTARRGSARSKKKGAKKTKMTSMSADKYRQTKSSKSAGDLTGTNEANTLLEKLVEENEFEEAPATTSDKTQRAGRLNTVIRRSRGLADDDDSGGQVCGIPVCAVS